MGVLPSLGVTHSATSSVTPCRQLEKVGEASKLFRCAWLIADKAAQYLGAIVGEQVPAMALLKAAGVRLAKKNVR